MRVVQNAGAHLPSLIKPCWQFSRTRLSDVLHVKARADFQTGGCFIQFATASHIFNRAGRSSAVTWKTVTKTTGEMSFLTG